MGRQTGFFTVDSDDEMLLAIKKNGGVVQMVALGAYVKV